jgi:protein TonB
MKKSRAWAIVIIAGAVVINIALLAVASLLASKQSKPNYEGDPIAVSLVQLAAPEPEQRQEVKEPEPPKQEQKSDFTPDLVQPSLGHLGGNIDPGVVINLGDIGGGGIQKEEFVFEAYELDQAPQPVVRVPPVYPYKAREQGIEGVVQIKLLVNSDGTVGQIYILDARPKGIFDDAVLKSVPQWKFNPGKIAGETVTAWVVTDIRFDL